MPGVRPPHREAGIVIRVLAVDLSLTHSGRVVTRDDGSADVAGWEPKKKGTERLDEIRSCVWRTVREFEPAVAIMEGSVFRSSSAYNMGQGGGVFRLALLDLGVPLVECPPASLKFFTGQPGNCGKTAVVAAAIRTLGFDGHDDNEADALVLWHIAQYALGQSELPKTAYRDRALLKLDLTPWAAVTGRR